MSIELVRYEGISRKFYVRVLRGMNGMKTRNMAKVTSTKCAQVHTDKPVAKKIIGTSEYFGIPVICAGRKSAREMYLETK